MTQKMMPAFVRTSATSMEVKWASMPVPSPGPREVRLAVKAIGVGIHDRFFLPDDVPFPYVVGIESAGVVVEVGSDVENLRVGDRFIANSALQPKGGCWAEFVIVASTSLIPIPDKTSFETAAGIMVAGKCAADSLYALGLKAGQSLLVAGASGAIGSLVVQLAAKRGIRVIGLASPANHGFVKELGAEAVVDYNAPDWVASVLEWAPGGTDAALAIPRGTGASSQPAVRSGGLVVTVSGDTDIVRRDVRVKQFAHRFDGNHDLAELIDDIDIGRIQLVIEKVYPFEDALSALEKTETGHARGKVIVTGPLSPDARES